MDALKDQDNIKLEKWTYDKTTDTFHFGSGEVLNLSKKVKFEDFIKNVLLYDKKQFEEKFYNLLTKNTVLESNFVFNDKNIKIYGENLNNELLIGLILDISNYEKIKKDFNQITEIFKCIKNVNKMIIKNSQIDDILVSIVNTIEEDLKCKSRILMYNNNEIIQYVESGSTKAKVIPQSNVPACINNNNNNNNNNIKEIKVCSEKNCEILNKKNDEHCLISNIKLINDINLAICIIIPSKIFNKSYFVNLIEEVTKDIGFSINNILISDQRDVNLKKYYDLFNNAPIGIFKSDEKGNLLEANNSMLNILECSSLNEFKSRIGNTNRLYKNKNVRKRIINTLKSNYKILNLEIDLVINNKTKCCIFIAIKDINDSDDNMLVLNGFAIDISERKEDKEKLKKLAFNDILIDCYNKTGLMKKLNNKILEEQYFAVMMIDIDNFKTINDSFGHTVGDEVLKLIVLRLKNVLRKDDVIGRFGGDEFTILLGIKEENDVVIIANKILDVFKNSFNIVNKDIHLSCSIGISIFPDDGITSEELLKNADVAMYKIKQNEKDNFNFYNLEMSMDSIFKVDIINSIKEIIKKDMDDIYIVYQPQFNIKNNKLIGIEALFRWKTHNPEKIINVLEETNLIIEFGDFIIEKIFRDMVELKKNSIDYKNIAINISGSQVQKDKKLASKLIDKANEYKIKKENIEIEITESVLINNAQAGSFLNEIKENDIKIAIDDFGKGYSSMNYLHKLPINKIKIDKSFIDEIQYNKKTESIIKAMTIIAKELEINIIAEGVEYEYQRDYLLKNNCNNVQGYLYSKPLKLNDLIDFLKK